jgi:hypothetical protein
MTLFKNALEVCIFDVNGLLIDSNLALNITRGGGDWSKAETLLRLLKDYRFEPSQCLFVGEG